MEEKFWEKSRTAVRFPKPPFSLNPEDKIGFLGSCFALELSRRCDELSLSTGISPFGTIYNPLSMGLCLETLLDRNLQGKPFFQNRMWRHFDFHSSRCFPASVEAGEDAIKHFNRLIIQGAEELNEIDYLIITLGTAWAYRLADSRRVVNNCHRCDNRLFERDNFQKWDPLGGTGTLGNALDSIKKNYGQLQVIVTVSPVRHLRDDARENSLSKAILRCLCEDLCRNRDWIHYFPSYEIVMDELRDYRWYAEDLCHPSSQAVDYILHRFFDWAGGETLLRHTAEQERLNKRRKHRAMV